MSVFFFRPKLLESPREEKWTFTGRLRRYTPSYVRDATPSGGHSFSDKDHFLLLSIHPSFVILDDVLVVERFEGFNAFLDGIHAAHRDAPVLLPSDF